MSRRRATVVLTAACLAACLSGCSVQTTVGVRFVPAAELENRLPSLLPADSRFVEPAVDCPEPLDAEVGATTTCTVFAGGRRYDAVVETVDDDSDPVELRLVGLRER
jgi:hypothetical protein